MNDMGWEDDEEVSRRNPLLLPLALLALIAIVIGVAIAGYNVYQRQTPTYAAQEWFESTWAIDSETVLDRTCDDQIEVSNAIASVASIRGLINFVDLSSIPGLTNLLGDIVLNIPLNDLGKQFEIDRSRLKYEEQMVDQDTGVVTVTGQIRFRVFEGWYPYRMNESWRVIREDDRWKWCGRQP